MSRNKSSTTLSPYRLRRELCRLWAQLSKRRHRQLGAVMVMMIASSFAEMLSLAAVVPLLAVLAEPERIWGTGIIQFFAGLMDWQQPRDLIVPLCLVFAGAAIVAGSVRLLTLRSTIGLANGIGSDLGIAVYTHTIYQPYAVHLQKNSSDQISTIASEVQQVVSILKDLLQLFTAGFVSLGLVSLLLWLQPWVTLAVSAVVSFGYGLATIYSKRQLKWLGPDIKEGQAKRIQILQEGLGAIRDVILDSKHPAYITFYGQVERRLYRSRGHGQFLSMAPRYGMEAVGLVAISMAALWLTNGEKGLIGVLPVLGALALGAQRLLPLLQLIYSSWSGCRLNLPALASVLSCLEQPIPESELLPPVASLIFENEIKLDGISFRYSPDQSWVLRDLNLTIHRGERIGILGETGSGKSTLVDVLMGLLEPSSGDVLVDGELLNGNRLRAWRSAIAHVPQNIFLSDATIAENIAFGVRKENIDYVRLKKCAQQAQIAGFIESLPGGYETQTGERGVMLSGGQRQRIGIARALYKQVSLLVLDEATSALDEITESQVVEAIQSLSPHLTIVMIAHRLSTLEHCDRLIRVKDKCIESA